MDTIEELLTRGVTTIVPGKKELKKILQSGQKLNIYLGIDPTAKHIHLGHAVPLRKLQTFVDFGHHVTLLIGDFTALVGDTSDKESERPILTPEEIKENFQTYKKQAEKLLDFTKVTIVHNSTWLEKLTYAELLRLKQQFSVNDFISRELIRKRLDEGKRVRLDETEYPIMQGYDSYFLDTDIQLGGADQIFNMQAGRTLQKAFRNKESFIIANTYLDGTDGRKMSKSWGNAIWLDDTPEDMYAKVMAIKDELIVQYYTLGTNISMSKVKKIAKKLKQGEHPMEIKKQLAKQIVHELCGEESANQAQESFEKRIQQHELPDQIPVIEWNEHLSLIDNFVSSGLTSSKMEAKRLFQQGGISIVTPNGEIALLEADGKYRKGFILKIGKRRIYQT